MKRTVLLIALLLGFATWLFARPFTVPCPIDGQPMQWTGQQQGTINHESCEYAHDAWVQDPGELTPHKVKHTTWVSCSDN
jgi:hypothetical protein